MTRSPDASSSQFPWPGVVRDLSFDPATGLPVNRAGRRMKAKAERLKARKDKKNAADR